MGGGSKPISRSPRPANCRPDPREGLGTGRRRHRRTGGTSLAPGLAIPQPLHLRGPAMSSRKRYALPVLLAGAVVAATGLVACGSDDPTGPTLGADVAVTLRQFSITVSPLATPRGRVSFHVTNAGTVPH